MTRSERCFGQSTRKNPHLAQILGWALKASQRTQIKFKLLINALTGPVVLVGHLETLTVAFPVNPCSDVIHCGAMGPITGERIDD